MREAGRNVPNYKYALVRVKFPDGKILQGVLLSKVLAVFVFMKTATIKKCCPS